MAELAKARCKQGAIVVTESMIKIGMWGREQSLPRQFLTGIDYKLVAMSLFGLGGAATLTFYGMGGERLIASFVKPKKAKEIKALLGF
jgi:hypothetical protein